MKQLEDKKTVDLFPIPRVRGRPPTGAAKSAAERQAARRERLREAGKMPLTVNVSADLHRRLTKFLEFKDTTKDEVVERFLNHALRKR